MRGGITICPIAVPILAIEVISPLLDSNHFAIVDNVEISWVLRPIPIKKINIKNKCQTSLDLEKRMKEILDEYSPILEGVEVTDLTDEVKERQKKLRLQPDKSKSATLDKTSDYSSESSSLSSSDSESSS